MKQVSCEALRAIGNLGYDGTPIHGSKLLPDTPALARGAKLRELARNGWATRRDALPEERPIVGEYHTASACWGGLWTITDAGRDAFSKMVNGTLQQKSRNRQFRPNREAARILKAADRLKSVAERFRRFGKSSAADAVDEASRELMQAANLLCKKRRLIPYAGHPSLELAA